MLLVATSCYWLLLVATGCYWLLLVAAGCYWLLLIATGCYWLSAFLGGRGNPCERRSLVPSQKESQSGYDRKFSFHDVRALTAYHLPAMHNLDIGQPTFREAGPTQF